MNDHVSKTMAGILNTVGPKENAPPSVPVQAIVGKVWIAVSSQGTADTMEIHGVYATKEAAEEFMWCKGFGEAEEWDVIDFANAELSGKESRREDG